jgi:hypothetical protein
MLQGRAGRDAPATGDPPFRFRTFPNVVNEQD